MEWKVYQESLGADIDILALKSDGTLDWSHRIAQIQLGWVRSDYSVSDLKANGRLIAKSPRMYEMLERLYILGDVAERHPELRKEIGELLQSRD